MFCQEYFSVIHLTESFSKKYYRSKKTTTTSFTLLEK